MRNGGIVSSPTLMARYVVPQMMQTAAHAIQARPPRGRRVGARGGHDCGGLNSTRSRWRWYVVNGPSVSSSAMCRRA